MSSLFTFPKLCLDNCTALFKGQSKVQVGQNDLREERKRAVGTDGFFSLLDQTAQVALRKAHRDAETQLLLAVMSSISLLAVMSSISVSPFTLGSNLLMCFAHNKRCSINKVKTLHPPLYCLLITAFLNYLYDLILSVGDVTETIKTNSNSLKFLSAYNMNIFGICMFKIDWNVLECSRKIKGSQVAEW